MKASELIKELQFCMGMAGDFPVVHWDNGRRLEVSGMWIQMVHTDPSEPHYFRLFHTAPENYQYDLFNTTYVPSIPADQA